jgi:hypothetical protein
MVLRVDHPKTDLGLGTPPKVVRMPRASMRSWWATFELFLTLSRYCDSVVLSPLSCASGRILALAAWLTVPATQLQT